MGRKDQKWDILWTQGVIQRPSNSDLVPLDLANENDHYIRAALEWIVTMREAISLSRVDPLAAIISYEDLLTAARTRTRDAALLRATGQPTDGGLC